MVDADVSVCVSGRLSVVDVGVVELSFISTVGNEVCVHHEVSLFAHKQLTNMGYSSDFN